METVVGVFGSRSDALAAAQRLRSTGLSGDRINLLSPGSEGDLATTVPADTGESPGTGAAIGGVVGAVAGAATGMQLLTAAALGFIPGVGPVLAAGLIAGAIAGIGGAAVGSALEHTLTVGIPKDELHVYEDALRRGRTVLIVLADDSAIVEGARRALREAGADSIDAAREAWWLGLREVEAATYEAASGDFARDERAYRRGFETALIPDLGGAPYEASVDQCRERDPDLYREDAFRRGFESGRGYRQRAQRAA